MGWEINESLLVLHVNNLIKLGISFFSRVLSMDLMFFKNLEEPRKLIYSL